VATSSALRRAGTRGVARADREAQIVDAAGHVFAEQGYAAASMGEIAARADVSKPLIYQYFGSKEGLLVACLRHAATLLGEEIERTAGLGAVGPARAVLTLDGVFRVLEGCSWPWPLLGDPNLPTTPEVTQVVGGYRERFTALAADGVGELLRLAGENDPDDTTAMIAVWINVFDALVTWWLDHPGQTPEEMTQRCVRLFTTVFGPIDVGPEAKGTSGPSG
jgi:AcrR family transcriptional regulator